MITVNDILQYLETVAPKKMQYEWDNTGMLCGSRSKEVKKILVALDPFEEVCLEAAEVGADLLLTHHPLIFSAPKAINDETDMGRAIMVLVRNGITAVNAHTNLDCAPGGINDTLAEILGLSDIEIIDPKGNETKYGLLRAGTVSQQPLNTFMAFVKERLGCQALRFVDGGKPVHKVAVGGGSCGSDLMDAVKAGCDTFVTADVKYNQFHDAKSYGINMIDAGHFHTENPGCIVLAEKLRKAFPEITVEVSQKHKDHMNFFL
jgi:dinuclear metal center YbgI/SA1388 family protein